MRRFAIITGESSGVTVTCLMPGPTDTGISKRLTPDDEARDRRDHPPEPTGAPPDEPEEDRDDY
jgi:short-subunit dehydrogenase